MYIYVRAHCCKNYKYLGPVVQSIVSLKSVKRATAYVSYDCITKQKFWGIGGGGGGMRIAFAMQKLHCR